MKKIALSVLALFFGIFAAFSQQDTSRQTYQDRKLKLEEVNFVSGYYHQEGNNSAVTGGIGTEKLTDAANEISINLSKYNKLGDKHKLGLSMGVDYYTSASSDMIDPARKSSASSSDVRVYPAINWNVEKTNGLNYGLNVSGSAEYDYRSFGFGGTIGKTSLDKNTSIQLNANAFLDNWSVIRPIELRPPGQGDDDDNYAQQARNSVNGSLVFTQVLNPRMQFAAMLEAVYQQGLLSTPYHRVYFNDAVGSAIEVLPDTRLKLPIGLRFNWFVTDRVILKTYYRYYWDDWNLTAHTIGVELPVKVTPFLSVRPFYRYYKQNQADYFAPYEAASVNSAFHSSDFDLSTFDSHYYGLGLRYKLPTGVGDIYKGFGLDALELKAGHYDGRANFTANQVSLHVKFALGK